ncbi:MFS transporter [Paraburkholderia sp. J67]|uniref:MFS transporter n=1 Tax=Paraburkholderia sp. J67 TaxID=2805435 RepID=UPI002ABD4A4D|nr:MFS transporter [Paraburkholderia sp. J67]
MAQLDTKTTSKRSDVTEKTDDIRNRRIYLTLYVVCFGSMASMRVCDAMLPSLSLTFGVTTQQASRAISAFAMAYGVAQLFWGPVGDRSGKLRVIALSTFLCAIGNGTAFFANSLDQLMAMRLISGASAAAIVPLSMAWIGDSAAYEQRRSALGKLLGATVLGSIAGQIIGGELSASHHWRGAFALIACFFVAGFMVLLADARKPDTLGSQSAESLVKRLSTAVREPWAKIVLLTAFIEGALAYSVLAFMPLHLHVKYGIPWNRAAVVTALYGVGGIVYGRLAGALLTRVGEGGAIRLGGTFIFLSFLVLSLSHQVYLSYIACFVGGFAFYALHNVLQINATQMAPAARATAVSLFSCVLFLGQSFGINAAGFVIGRWSTEVWLNIAAFGLLSISMVFFMLHRRQSFRDPVTL